MLLYDIGTNSLLKAKIRASQRMAAYHHAWVCVLKKTGSVITGHCSCMVGLVILLCTVTIIDLF